MIRPLSMGNPIQFKGYTITGGDDEQINSKEQSKKKSGLTESEKKIFLAGAFLGAVMGVGGTMLNDTIKMNSMIKDMQEEVAFGTDSIKIEDVTDDDVPEIILVGSDGNSTIYDMNKNKVFIDMDGDRVEKIR